MQFSGIDIILAISEGRIGIADMAYAVTMNQLYCIENANKIRRGQGGRIKRAKHGRYSYGYEIVRSIDLRARLFAVK